MVITAMLLATDDVTVAEPIWIDYFPEEGTYLALNPYQDLS
jgi:hypothetical protein